jgi:predicted ArsR family transcriptional regulator
VRDLWTTRDFPILRAYVELDAEGEDLLNATDHVAEQLGIPLDELERSLEKLSQAGYIETGATFGGPYVTAIRERGLREVGAWPTPETALDRMIAALEAIADNTDDEDTRTRARKILDGLGGAGRQIGISVVGAAIGGQIPGV